MSSHVFEGNNMCLALHLPVGGLEVSTFPFAVESKPFSGAGT